MITFKQGDLFKSDAEAIVNTVNCVGVMGKGVALEVKKKFPTVYTEYKKACETKAMKPGFIQSVATQSLFGPKYILNFPTKRHWKANSKIDDIEIGLIALVNEIKELKIESIAVPPLGCGNGGLDWDIVKPKIVNALSELENVNITIYEPEKMRYQLNEIDEIGIIDKKPTLTKERNLLLNLLSLYTKENFVVSVNETHILAYLLQVQGQQLGLEFAPSKNGPYSEKFNLVLKKFKGHYLEAYSSTSKQSMIRINTDIFSHSKEDDEVKQIAASVLNFIRGYRSEVGLELFSIVLWETQKMWEIDDYDILLNKVLSWKSMHHHVLKKSDIVSLYLRIKNEIQTFKTKAHINKII